LGGGVAEPVPWDVAQSIRQRVAALPEAASELLRVAAVVGRGAPLDVLLAVGEQMGWQKRGMVEALEAACQARLLVEEGEDTYQFAHDIARDVVEGDLGIARRIVLHQQVARSLEREVPNKAPPEVLAYHYARGGEPEKAAEYLERAGDRAQGTYAHRAAQDFYRELVVRLEGLGRTAEAARAREKLGAALKIGVQYNQALEALERAAEAYRAGNDLEGLARVTAQIGWVHSHRGMPQEGVARVQPILEVLSGQGPASLGLADLYVALAVLLDDTGRYSEAVAAAERAVELAQALHDDRLLGQAERLRGAVVNTLGRLEEGTRILKERAIPLLKTANDLRGLTMAFNHVGWACAMQGEYQTAEQYYGRALEVAERLSDATALSLAWCNCGEVAFARGNWTQARAAFEQAKDIIGPTETSWVSAYPLADSGLLHLAEGKAELASECFTAAITIAERGMNLEVLRLAHCALAERDLLEGHPEAARARLKPLLDRPGEQELAVALVLLPLAWAHLDLGNADEADRLVARGRARAAPAGARPALVYALRLQAMITIRQYWWQKAEGLLDEALALSQTVCDPYAEAKILHTYGLMEIERGEPVQGRERLEAALVILHRLGERLYAERIERTLAELGAPVATDENTGAS
jgi:tetratricopeptide (TPR) repeat protein